MMNMNFNCPVLQTSGWFRQQELLSCYVRLTFACCGCRLHRPFDYGLDELLCENRTSGSGCGHHRATRINSTQHSVTLPARSAINHWWLTYSRLVGFSCLTTVNAHRLPRCSILCMRRPILHYEKSWVTLRLISQRIH